MRRTRRRGSALVVVTATVLGREAAANPPPPKSPFPDPTIEAPTHAEAPTVMRKHATTCFLLFPTGGALASPCAPALGELALGSTVERGFPDDTCVLVPFGTAKKAGKPTPCPPALTRVHPAGKVDKFSEDWLAEEKKRTAPAPLPWSPPVPAKLAPAAPAQPEGGCGGCATSPPRPVDPTMVGAGAAASVAVLRRRRRRR